jgi:hypothetical protein
MVVNHVGRQASVPPALFIADPNGHRQRTVQNDHDRDGSRRDPVTGNRTGRLALEGRLAKLQLVLHPDKTRLIEFGRRSLAEPITAWTKFVIFVQVDWDAWRRRRATGGLSGIHGLRVRNRRGDSTSRVCRHECCPTPSASCGLSGRSACGTSSRWASVICAKRRPRIRRALPP